MKGIKIERDGKITLAEIKEIRKSVGWDPHRRRHYDELLRRVMKHTYSYFTIRKDGKLVALSRVISDGYIHAFIVDVNVRPEFQSKGLGTRLLRYIISELRKDKIKWVSLNFDPHDRKLKSFYEKAGFDTKRTRTGEIMLRE